MVAVGRTTRGGDASRSWLAVTATPHAALAGAVRGYGGFHESSIRPVLRRELPATDVVVVLDLTGSLRVERPCSPSQSAAGVVAGVGRTPVSTRHSGEQVALEIRMSALAARSLLGASSGELSDRVVDVGELWGRAGNEVLERARQLQTWPERFALVEDVLLRRQRDHAGTVDADPALAAAHGLLVDREGDLSMQELLDITGWGRRRLADRFREQVGMTPKALARLARFRHAAAAALAGSPLDRIGGADLRLLRPGAPQPRLSRAGWMYSHGAPGDTARGPRNRRHEHRRSRTPDRRGGRARRFSPPGTDVQDSAGPPLLGSRATTHSEGTGVDMHGELTFFEIGVPDSGRAQEFYARLFGWGFPPTGQDDQVWVRTPTIKAGLHGQDDEARIASYFSVDDIEVAVRTVRELGGTAEDPRPEEPGFGRFTACTDDQGVQFGLHQALRTT